MRKLKEYYLDGRLFMVVSCLFAATIALIIFFFSPHSYITSLLIDDAIYYPVVANNIAQGYGSTFDTINLTNGYHPLWCWLNIPFSLMAKNNMDKIFIFKTINVLTVLLMLMVWCILLKKSGLANRAIAIFILLMGGSYWWSIKVYYSGLEVALVTLFIGLSLLVFREMRERQDIKLALLLGFLTAATFLSRLDSIFFIIVLYLFLVFRNRRITKQIIVSVCVFALTVSPYLIWNKINFGAFMPISGLKKSCYALGCLSLNLNKLQALLNNEIERISKFINIYILLLIIFLSFFIAYAILKTRKNKAPAKKGYAIFSIVYLCAILHFIFNLFFMSEADVNWYHYLIYLSMFLFLAVLVDRIFNSNISKLIYNIFYVTVIILLTAMVSYGFSKFPRGLTVAIAEAAAFAKSSTPEDTIFGMNDPGAFQILSNRRTIAFNGLIANRRILGFVLTGQQDKIVKEYNVKYYVIIINPGELKPLGIKPVYWSKPFLAHWQKHSNNYLSVAILKADDVCKHRLFR